MYPGISDLFNDLFGTHFSVSFPPSFGTLVAISFLLAALTLTKELKRKEALGLLQSTTRTTTIGEPASFSEIFFNAVFGFVLGFKVLYAVFLGHDFFSNPQGAILSLKGNWAGGIAGAALFAYLKYREKEKKKLTKPETITEVVYPHQLVSEITMMSALGGIVGAKLFDALEDWDNFIHDPIGLLFSGSGLTMYGGLIVGAIVVLRYAKKNNIPALHLCDANAPGLMLAYGFGRLGCQVAGDGDWGVPNLHPKPDWMGFLPEWFWSYRYPHNVVNQDMPIPNCQGQHCFILEYPVFPTPLYESIVCIGLFFLLWGIRKKFTTPGMMFSVYLLLNGIERFLVEQIRVNSKYHFAGLAFTQAQLISLCLILLGTFGIFYFRAKGKKMEHAVL